MNFLDILHSSNESLLSRLRVLSSARMLDAHREQEQDAIRRELAQRVPIERHEGGFIYGFDDDGLVTCTTDEFYGYDWTPIGRGNDAGAAQAAFVDAEAHHRLG